MAYTVKKLAKISGVSIRTLRFYDEIGILKPAYYGDNNYRYYEEAQIMILQQILFFRELGFQLDEIKRIISSPDFDQINTLESHKKILESNINHTVELIKTVDKTISHLKGKYTMKLEDIFHGFNAEKQQMYENFLVKNGVSQEMIKSTQDKIKYWTKDQWIKNKEEVDAIHDELISAIKNHLQPSSPEVQAIIRKHYQLTKTFWTPTRSSYLGLSKLYESHPDFVKFYDDLHPELLQYLMEAMKIFAENELS